MKNTVPSTVARGHVDSVVADVELSGKNVGRAAFAVTGSTCGFDVGNSEAS